MTVVAIHQPNFIPWFGYFHKIKSCTDFVFLDDVTFSRNTMINRVKIKTREGGKTYITVPIVHKSLGSIDNIKIANSSMKKILDVIEYNYKDTDCFDDIFPWIKDMVLNWEYLRDMNIFIIKKICESLKIDVDFLYSSNLEYNDKLRRTDRLIGIVKSLNGDTYLSGNGSGAYLERHKFNESGIKLTFQNLTYPIYPQKYKDFVSGLSILDMLMNIGVEETRKFL